MKQYVQTDLEADCPPADEHAHVTDHQRSLTSFEVTRSAREDQAATVDARPRDGVNERNAYKPSLQISCQRPSSCSKEGLWPW